MEELIAKTRNDDEKGIYQFKLESLEFAKDSLVNSVQYETITPQQYLANVKKYKNTVTKLLGEAK